MELLRKQRLDVFRIGGVDYVDTKRTIMIGIAILCKSRLLQGQIRVWLDMLVTFNECIKAQDSIPLG